MRAHMKQGDAGPARPVMPFRKTKIDRGGVDAVAFSPDGRYLVCGRSEPELVVLDVESGDPVPPVAPGRAFAGSTGYVSHIIIGKRSYPSSRMSAGGATIAWSHSGTTVSVWDFDRAEPIGQLVGHEKHCRALAFSPDGRWLATGSNDTTVRLWDVETSAARHVLRGHEHPVLSVSFSPDGKWLASSARENYTIIWDVETGAEVTRLAEPDGSWSMERVLFHPGGRYLVTAGSVHVWDVATFKHETMPWGRSSAINDAAFSPGGEWLVLNSLDDQERSFFHVRRAGPGGLGEEVAVFPRDKEVDANGMAVSPDGKVLVAGASDEVWWWDLGAFH